MTHASIRTRSRPSHPCADGFPTARHGTRSAQRGASDPCAGPPQAESPDRRTQRLPVGPPRAQRGARPGNPRHQAAAAVDHDGHPTPESRRTRRAVLVRLRPCRAPGTSRRHGDARRNRHRAPDDQEISGNVRAGPDGSRRRTDLQGRQDRLADRHGRRPLDRQLAGGPSHVLSAGRAVHDAHPLQQHTVGGLGHRCAEVRRPRAVRRRGRQGNELAGHAGGPEPRLAGHDG